jgi:hypothetical protein
LIAVILFSKYMLVQKHLVFGNPGIAAKARWARNRAGRWVSGALRKEREHISRATKRAISLSIYSTIIKEHNY